MLPNTSSPRIVRVLNHSRRSRTGFSLIEAAVVIGIILILLAISIPVVRDMRSITRRSNCDQNLIRLVFASQAYTDDFGHLPSGTLTFNATLLRAMTTQPVADLESGDDDATGQNPSGGIVIRSLPEDYHQNWITSLLPYLDRQGLFQSIQFEYGVYSEINRLPREADLALLRCPASGETQLLNTTSYVAIHDARSVPIGQHNSGLMMANRWIELNEIEDGMGFTILAGEKLSPSQYDLSWMSGTRSSLRNAGTPINADVPIEAYRDPLFVGGLASHHVGGATVAMADGAVKFLSDTINMPVYQEMANRTDGREPDQPLGR